MDYRAEAEVNIIRSWIRELSFPFLNGVVILTLFPFPFVLLGKLFEKFTKIDSQDFKNLECNTMPVVDASEYEDGGSVFDNGMACSIKRILEDFFKGSDLATLISDASFFGIFALLIFVVIIFSIVRSFINNILGTLDFNEGKFDEIYSRKFQIKIEDGENIAKISNLWDSIKFANDEANPAINYHRKRRLMISVAMEAKERGSFFCFYFILSTIGFILSLGIKENLFNDVVREEYFLKLGGSIMVTYFLFGVIFLIGWLHSQISYAQKIIETMRYDFAFYRIYTSSMKQRLETHPDTWVSDDLFPSFSAIEKFQMVTNFNGLLFGLPNMLKQRD